MRTRKATLKDIPNIVEMWKGLGYFHREKIIKNNPQIRPYSIVKKDSDKVFERFVKSNIISGDGVVFIAEVNGYPAGYAICHIRKNIPIFRIERIGHTTDLYVKEKYRGLKISSRLINEVFAWLKKKGISHASIKVSSKNRSAHSIYKKWGFFDYHIEMRKKIK